MTSCIMNLLKTVVGSGTLSFPNAFANVGPQIGVVLLLIFAGFSAFGLHLLAAAAQLTKGPGDKSFRSLAVHAVPSFATVIDVAVAAKCFGVATSYLVVVGDTVPLVVDPDDGSLGGKRWPWILLATVLLTPLCLLEKFDYLKVTSAASMIIVFVLALMMLGFRLHSQPSSLEDWGLETNGDTTAGIDLETAKTITVFVYGYTCHQNIFAVVNELKKPTKTRTNAVILITIGSAFALYILVALTGYATFGSKAKGDVLDNYGDTPVLSTVRLIVAALVAASFPLQSHPARACVLNLLDSCFPQQQQQQRRHHTELQEQSDIVPQDQPPLDDDDDPPPTTFARSSRTRTLVTLVFLVASLAIALTVESLTTILAVVGATGSTTVSYIVPGGVYFALAPPGWKRTGALGLFLFGCVVMPTALILIFL